MYMLSSFIRVIEHWTPTAGDKLACTVWDNLHVLVLYDGRLVETVPTNLTRVISNVSLEWNNNRSDRWCIG